MSFTFNDLFCGAGGSISGLVAAGAEFVLGANHDPRAIETVAANYSDAELLCADINNLDMRRIPKTQVLWASVICTEGSPAGGRRKNRGQAEMFEEHGHVRAATFERTRACALDVIRATEVHRYDAVIVENVVEFAHDWELFWWWIDGMCKLRPGYEVKIVNASAAHIGGPGNLHAPQWRDRIFIVFVRNGVTMPDLEPRPLAWCARCDTVGETHQSWKRADRPRIGKYGQQYVYRHTACGDVVEPLVRPAGTIIDWTDVGQRIGDRPKPLAPNTMRRIEWGVQLFAQPVVVAHHGNTWEKPGGGYVRAWPASESPLMTRSGTPGDGIAIPPVILNVNHHGDDGRPIPAEGAPLSPRTTKIGDGVVSAPFVMVNRTNNRPRGVDEPLAPFTTGANHGLVSPEPFLVELRGTTPEQIERSPRGVDDAMGTIATGRHHGLTVPPGCIVKHYAGNARPEHMSQGIDEPLGAITTKDHHSLVTWPEAMVVPYRRGRAKRVTEPLHTLATRPGEALVTVEVDVADCHFRMLKPREHLRGQRFEDDYVVTGNLGEQTMQAGNAVPCNVAQWIGERLAEVLS